MPRDAHRPERSASTQPSAHYPVLDAHRVIFFEEASDHRQPVRLTGGGRSLRAMFNTLGLGDIVPAIIELQDFMVLSATINYQLTSSPVNWYAVLALARDERYSHTGDEDLIRLMEYVHEAYGTSTRRLGPRAVLHPIRTAALLYRTVPNCPQSDIATALLHDKEEDLHADRFHLEAWQRLEGRYQAEMLAMDSTWNMRERIGALTRNLGEDYFGYLGRVVDVAEANPDLVRIKLADRLDNTLDLSVDVRSETREVDCFELMFDVLFTQSHLGQQDDFRHPITGRINGSRRLYQLYKNAIVLSILRQRGKDRIDPPTERLFHALAHTSLRQARQILVHLFIFHINNIHHQRSLLHEALEYCQQRRIANILPAENPHRLDGVFQSVFNIPDRAKLGKSLDQLYKDKPLMALVAIAFAATFSSFHNDPAFSIAGIDSAGLHPHDES